MAVPSREHHSDSAGSVRKGKFPREWIHGATPSGMVHLEIKCTPCTATIPLGIVNGTWALLDGLGLLFNGLGGTATKLEAVTAPEEVKAVMIPRHGLPPCNTRLPFEWEQGQSAAMP